MQTALVQMGILTIENGDDDSNSIGLEAYADAEVIFIGSETGTEAAAVQVALDEAKTIWVGAYEFGGPVVTVPNTMFRLDAPGGFALRVSASAVVGDQLYYLWKRCLIG